MLRFKFSCEFLISQTSVDGFVRSGGNSTIDEGLLGAFVVGRVKEVVKTNTTVVLNHSVLRMVLHRLNDRFDITTGFIMRSRFVPIVSNVPCVFPSLLKYIVHGLMNHLWLIHVLNDLQSVLVDDVFMSRNTCAHDDELMKSRH